MKAELTFLGLLNRGGRILFGPSLEHSLGKVDLLLIATDAAHPERMEAKAKTANTITRKAYTKAELGQALGYDELSFVAIRGKKEAKAFLAKAKGEEI